MTEVLSTPQTASDMISGSEWETTIYFSARNYMGQLERRPLVAYQGARLLTANRMGMRAIANHLTYLENGGLAYMDIGDRLEYATPEEDTPSGAMQRDLDGEVFITHMLESVVRDETSKIEGYELYKRTFSSGRIIGNRKQWPNDPDEPYIASFGSGPTSCGYHINTGTERIPGFTQISAEGLAVFGLHAATRALYLGAGVVVPSFGGRESAFSIHQRAPLIFDDFSDKTTDKRPVVNLRDEPLAGERAPNWMRLHDINADPCMSYWAKRMTFGTNRLILRLGQIEEALPDYRPSNEYPLYRITRQTGFDLTHKKTVKLENGKTITPLDIQRVLHEACLKLKDRFELIEDELWTLEQWGTALDDLEENPKKLADRTDWVMKKYTLDKLKAKLGLAERDWDDPRLEMIDHDYSSLNPKSRGMQLRQNQKLWGKWRPATDIGRTEADIKKPPQGTRAAIRGEFIRRHGVLPGKSLHIEGVRVSWQTLSVDDCHHNLGSFDTDLSVLDDFPDFSSRVMPWRSDRDLLGCEERPDFHGGL